MILIMLQIVAVVLAGFLDRLRGDAKHLLGNRNVDKVALGYCMAVVAGFPFDMIITPLIVAAMVLGMSFGWGEPIGAALEQRKMIPEKLEWWQIGALKTNVWMSLVVRGAMWGAPVAAIGFLAPSLLWFLPAYMIAFPASVIVAQRLFSGNWEYMEYARGWMVAALILWSTM